MDQFPDYEQVASAGLKAIVRLLPLAGPYMRLDAAVVDGRLPYHLSASIRGFGEGRVDDE